MVLSAQEAKRREASGEVIVNLTLGDTDQDTDPAIVATAVEALHAGRTHYTPIGGISPLCEIIARQQSSQDGHAWTARHIVVGPGAQNALFAALMCLCNPGDEVLALDPVYATYQGAVNAAGATLATIPMHFETGNRLCAAELSQAITPRTRILLINSPNNPAGLTLTAEDVALLTDTAKAHDLWIISDEVYRDLVFEGAHIPFAQADLERLVILNSLSKSHAMTGWRIGWAVCPMELADAMRDLAMCSLFGSPHFIQDAAITALGLGAAPTNKLRLLMQDRCQTFLRQMAPVPGVQVIPPTAGMFALIDISALGLDSRTFAAQLLDGHGVAVIPGTAFSDQGTSYVRVSFASDDKTLRAGAKAIGSFARARLNGQEDKELEQQK
ncbi:MAG: pyridoxal phosphate-dependent aminotransferase [Sulfitobacter sp.]